MARDHVITTDYTPISTRFLLAPSSRPHSPSTSSSFSKQVSLLSQRLTALDQERRKLGPNHLTTFMLGLEGLESTILKGEIKGRSPWSHSEQKEEDQSTEEDELQGIPLNMEEWEEWEKKKIERRQAKEIEQEEKEAEVKVDVKTKAMKRRRTSEEELSTGIETPKSSDNSRRKRSKDKPINAMFSASKQSSTSASNKKPERPPSVTPRASLKSKSQSFPSLDTLNSAGKSLSADLEPKKDGNEKEDSHRRGESWRSGEEGAEEEVLGEVGHGSQMALPTSTNKLVSSNPPSTSQPLPPSRSHAFPSSPIALSNPATNAYTSTPYHANGTTSTTSLALPLPAPSSPQSSRSNSPESHATKQSSTLHHPKIHRLSSVSKLGSAASLKGDEEGREIEDFLGKESLE
ncbi:hypothetical protein JCM5353_008391 [Sporobolomyces roseus]